MTFKLEELNPKHELAFLEAMRDYAVADPLTFKHLHSRKNVWSPTEFQKFVKECEKQRLDWRPKANATSITQYVLVDDRGAICGIGKMRFPLNSVTEVEGGNLELDVPPAKRRQGFGALTLNRMLFEAVRAGLARVLVTCISDHEAAVKIIKKNRGEFQDEVVSPTTGEKISRFWIRFR